MVNKFSVCSNWSYLSTTKHYQVLFYLLFEENLILIRKTVTIGPHPPKAYSKPCQTSKMEHFEKIDNSYLPLFLKKAPPNKFHKVQK